MYRSRWGGDVRDIPTRSRWIVRVTMVVLVLTMWADPSLTAQQIDGGAEFAALPDAPQAQVEPRTISPSTTDVHKDEHAAGHDTAPGKDCRPARENAQGTPGAAKVGDSLTNAATSTTGTPNSATQNSGTPCKAKFDYFYPLGKPPKVGPLTPMDKLRIAASDVVDPFNLLTIGATAAITVGSDPDTGYGPGMKGWAKNSGTLLTEDMSGAFLVTFAIPSIAGQDPRYHRMPGAPIRRRVMHVIVQPVWTRSDKGDPMPNYGMLIGVPAAITLSNVYVPGRKQGVWPTAQSSAIAIASAPLDNLITEFLPDVAKRVSIHIVLIQSIVNHIALTEGQ